MAHKVFISYSRKDSVVAESILEYLESKGISCWLDKRNITLGMDYAESIVHAIRESEIFLLVLSHNSNASDDVLKEVYCAVNNKLSIIPFRISDVVLRESMEYHLGMVQWLDATAGKPSDHFPRLYGRIEEILFPTQKTTSKPKTTVKPKAPATKRTSGEGKVVTKNYSNGDVYVGQMKDGKPHGKGKYTWSNGDFYEGDWVNGKMHGRGKCTWVTGDSYEGDWVKNQRTGKGKHIYASGDFYDGDFVNGLNHGKGKYTWATGDSYEGDWVNDKRTGKGKCTWANGDIYEGDWVNSKMHGKGKYTWADGSVFEGEWKIGEKVKGVLHNKNGKIIKRIG